MAINKHRSRRHLAALTFLSNISLDGTHRDTNLGRYYNIGKALSFDNDIVDKENLYAASEVNRKSCTDSYDRTLKEVHEGKQFDSTNTILDQVDQGFNEKLPFSENADHRKSFKKCHISVTEKHTFFSSTESIITGTSGRCQKSSLTSSDQSLNKEGKCLRIEGVPKLKDERLILMTKSKVSCHVFSCLPRNNRLSIQDCGRKEGGRKRYSSGTRPLSTVSDSTDPAHVIGLSCLEDPSEISFCDLLIPSRSFSSNKQKPTNSEHSNDENEKPFYHPVVARCSSYEPTTQKTSLHHLPTGVPILEHEELRYSSSHQTAEVEYMPDILDDPELRAGKHRKLLRFPSYMTSVTDYTKPLDLKKELNDKFREKFPHIQLTLSKLRSLKREMLKIAMQDCDCDILTVAQSYVYFEKIILKMYVNKQNRKMIAGACLILSAKMNDVKGDSLTNLIEKTETAFRLNRRELLSWELASLVALEFGLHLPGWQVNPHYQRLQFDSS